MITIILTFISILSGYMTYLIYKNDSDKGLRIHTKTYFHYFFDFRTLYGLYNWILIIIICRIIN